MQALRMQQRDCGAHVSSPHGCCAVAIAGTYLCGAAESHSETAVEAVARAWVELLTTIDATCTKKGDASACALVNGTISDAAAAHTHAVAEGWAGTVGDCGCDLNVDDASESLGGVLVAATSRTLRNVCVGAQLCPAGHA